MRRKALPLTVIIGLLAFLAYALWFQHENPREIVATGTAFIPARSGGEAKALRTRDVRIAGVVFKEIEMVNGTWIPCAGDCARAAFESVDEFWQSQQPSRR